MFTSQSTAYYDLEVIVIRRCGEVEVLRFLGNDEDVTLSADTTLYLHESPAPNGDH